MLPRSDNGDNQPFITKCGARIVFSEDIDFLNGFIKKKKNLVCSLSYSIIFVIFVKNIKNLKYILCVHNRKMSVLFLKPGIQVRVSTLF